MRVLPKNAKVDLLSRVPLFAHCSKRELAAVGAAADEISVAAESDLMREGETGREFVVLVDGGAEVRRNGQKINELGPGEFFGEISLLTGSPRTATVRTTQPSRLLVVSDRAFSRLLRESPSIQAKVLAALAERLAPESL